MKYFLTAVVAVAIGVIVFLSTQQLTQALIVATISFPAIFALKWALQYIFITIVIKYAEPHMEVLGTRARENRVQTIMIGRKFYDFFFDNKGESFSHQLLPSEIVKEIESVEKKEKHPFGTLVYKFQQPVEEIIPGSTPPQMQMVYGRKYQDGFDTPCTNIDTLAEDLGKPVARFDTKKVSVNEEKIEWTSEEDKYWIVDNPGFNLVNTLTGMRKWIYAQSAVYIFPDNWLLQKSISWEDLNIQYFDKDNKLVDVTPKNTAYLFRTFVNYAFILEDAEDATGNPVSILYSVRARVTNPYYARVIIQDWDQNLRDTANNEGGLVVKKFPFSKIHSYEIVDGKVELKEAVEKAEIETITARFEDAIKYRLMKELHGFEVVEVNVRNIVPSGAIKKAMEDLFATTAKAQGTMLESEAEKTARETVAKGLKAEMAVYMKNPALGKMMLLSKMTNLRYLAAEGKAIGLTVEDKEV